VCSFAYADDLLETLTGASSQIVQQDGKWYDFILKKSPQKSKQIPLTEKKEIKSTQEAQTPWTDSANGFEINFNNVSVIEVVRTLSKMTNLNFVFNEQDLNFNVTIVSSGPTSLANLISTFVQILRIHGLTLSAKGNTFVIHATGDVNSPAQFVMPNEKIPFETALITKAFNLTNMLPSKILPLVRPMLSSSALMEASDDTRHLIITDTPATIHTLSKLIEYLDSPTQAAEIGVYKVQNYYATSLAVLANKILAALPEKSDVLLIPQQTKETIIIVAAPYLVKKTLNLLNQLDQYSKDTPQNQKQINYENIFIYAPKFRSYEAVLAALNTINANLDEMSLSNSDLKEVISSSTWIEEISSFLFVGDPEHISKLQEILKEIDTSTAESYPSSVVIYTYDPQYITVEDLTVALQNVATNLKALKNTSLALIHMIETVHSIPKTESVMFIGEKIALLQLQEILKAIDIDIANVPVVKSPNFTFLVYELQYVTPQDLQVTLNEISSTLKKTEDPDQPLIDTIQSMRFIPQTNSVIFVGSKRALQNVETLLAKFDTLGQQEKVHQQFFIYKPIYRKPKDIIESLNEIISHLKNEEMINPQMLTMIEHVKLVQETGSLLFTGSPQTYTAIEALLKNVDTPPGESAISALGAANYLIYNISHAQEKNLMEALKSLAKKLESAPTQDSELIYALKHPQYIQQTHSLVFVGDEPTMQEISTIMTKLDVAKPGENPTQFLLYVPQYLEPSELMNDLHTMSGQLSNSGLNDQAVILTLDSANYSKKTGAIILTGTQESLDKVQNILKTIDVPDSSIGQHLFIYKPQSLSPQQLIKSLQVAVKQLNGTDDFQLYKSVKEAKIIAGSISFKGSESSIHHIQEMLKTLDTPIAASTQEQVLVYHPQYISVTQLQENLEKISDKLEDEPSSAALYAIIKNSYLEKKAHALVFHGTTQNLDQLKSLLQDLDQPITKQETVFVYTLQHVSIKEAKTYLNTLEDHLREATHPDTALLEVIESAKPIMQSNSLMFTGNAAALDRLKALLAKYDSADNAASPKATQSSFLMYKPKYIQGDELVDQLKKTAKELQASGLADPYLIKSLENVRYNKSSNSITITGNEQTIARTKEILALFDVPVSAKPTLSSGDYLVYHPIYVSGPSLEQWMRQSTINLEKSGLDDPNLIKSLQSMHYSEQTTTLTFSGDTQSLTKVKELILNYDNEAHAEHTPGESPAPKEGFSFLVYKLQYHQGNEIIDAMQTIAQDIRKFQTDQKTTEPNALLETIASIQWLKITNSLLMSGTTTNLEKIKGLVKKLDIPLQQVFLEVLIIRTSMTDVLNFGLRWGAAGNLLEKFSTAFGLFPTNGNFSNLNNFGNSVATAGKTVPGPSAVGFANGFDLGMIGDIIFHKGKSFLTLGALAAALQSDNQQADIQTHKIIGQDNQPAHIFSGINRPFDLSTFTQTPTASGGGSTTTATNEYRDVGFDLQITPIIGGDDVISLVIDQNFSESTAATLTDTTNTVVTKQITTTRARVPNNHFVAISGVLKDTRSRSKTGIPCLGGLPVVGALFSDTSRTNDKDNLIIFIRPQLVTQDQQMIDMTERQEDQFRESAGALELQYDIDDAVNMMVPIDELE
jgi:type II secretory pathway component GspD/PulD (secretin)